MRIFNIGRNIIILFVALLLTGCYSETYDVASEGGQSSMTQVVLTFVTPNASSTRSATEDPDGYEVGVEWENYIDISGGDYKIYFFSYSNGDEKGGKYIAEFEPTEIKTVEASNYTSYMVTGEVPTTLLEETSFRVVMLANWGGWYPSVTEGTTTIDDLVEGTNTTYTASNKFTLSESNLIPFYGVQEYTGVNFVAGSTARLATPVSLLRAVAKVEVILTADSDYGAFDNVSIVNYNATGYCAPAGVYTAEDYDTEKKNNPTSGNWGDEWIKELHLYGNANDTGSKTQALTNISGASQDTWRIYVPEYDNSSTDYSYISVTIDGLDYQIYFAEYDEDGKTDNTERNDLKRNNIYRFYVTYEYDHISVWVEKWDEKYDNTFNFDSDYET